MLQWAILLVRVLVDFGLDGPRPAGCFGAAYTLGLAAKLAHSELACLGLSDIVGLRGLITTESAEEDQAPVW